MKRKSVFCSILLVIMFPVVSSAAYLDYTYTNAYETNEIHFTIVNDADYEFFEDVRFSNYDAQSGSAAEDWGVAPDTPFSVEFNDPTGTLILPESGLFDLRFIVWGDTDYLDFTLEWTEFLAGGITEQGVVVFEDGVAIATPLPASAWMLFSGLALFVGIRRRNAG